MMALLFSLAVTETRHSKLFHNKRHLVHNISHVGAEDVYHYLDSVWYPRCRLENWYFCYVRYTERKFWAWRSSFIYFPGHYRYSNIWRPRTTAAADNDSFPVAFRLTFYHLPDDLIPRLLHEVCCNIAICTESSALYMYCSRIYRLERYWVSLHDIYSPSSPLVPSINRTVSTLIEMLTI